MRLLAAASVVLVVPLLWWSQPAGAVYSPSGEDVATQSITFVHDGTSLTCFVTGRTAYQDENTPESPSPWLDLTASTRQDKTLGDPGCVDAVAEDEFGIAPPVVAQLWFQRKEEGGEEDLLVGSSSDGTSATVFGYDDRNDGLGRVRGIHIMRFDCDAGPFACILTVGTTAKPK